MTFLEAAKAILEQASEPLSAGEVVRRALQQGLITTAGKTPSQTLYTVMLTETRRGGEKAVFERVGRGLWRLRNRAAEPEATPSIAPNYWLLTVNPSFYDINTLLRNGKETWGETISGAPARIRIREMRPGDLALVYITRPRAEVVCEVRVATTPVERRGHDIFNVELARALDPPIQLQRLRSSKALHSMEFLRQPQLSVSRVSAAEYAAVQALIGSDPPPPPEEYTHDQVMWYLIAIGEAHDCSVWVAQDSRRRSWEGQSFPEHCIQQLPKLGLDDETMSLIQGIDVLWLHRSRIVAAFEIEHTTLIYSGLLRLADLVALQPNTRIASYIVAAAERRASVGRELNRPAFARLETPLGDVCRFIPYDRLAAVYETAKTWGGSLRVDIAKIAEDLRSAPKSDD